jgi:hypothetical protein
VEDLGPGDWVGPVEDPEDLNVPPRWHWCGPMVQVISSDGDALLDEQEAYFDDGQRRVMALADRYRPGDSDLHRRIENASFLDQCLVEEGAEPFGDILYASVSREPDGTVVYESRVSQGTDELEFTVAMGVDDEWFVMVEVSHPEGAEGPDAVELLDLALANLEELPVPESDEA